MNENAEGAFYQTNVPEQRLYARFSTGLQGMLKVSCQGKNVAPKKGLTNHRQLARIVAYEYGTEGRWKITGCGSRPNRGGGP